MKKRDYLSPHTWQQSKFNKSPSFSSSLNEVFNQKKSLKIGRYIALICLAIVVIFLIFHHRDHAKSSLNVAKINQINPIIQTITLPTATSNASTA
jgi:hypothetical protein